MIALFVNNVYENWREAQFLSFPRFAQIPKNKKERKGVRGDGCPQSRGFIEHTGCRLP